MATLERMKQLHICARCIRFRSIYQLRSAFRRFNLLDWVQGISSLTYINVIGRIVQPVHSFWISGRRIPACHEHNLEVRNVFRATYYKRRENVEFIPSGAFTLCDVLLNPLVMLFIQKIMYLFNYVRLYFSLFHPVDLVHLRLTSFRKFLCSHLIFRGVGEGIVVYALRWHPLVS